MNNKILTAVFALSVATSSVAYAQGTPLMHPDGTMVRTPINASTTVSTRPVNPVPVPAGVYLPVEPAAGVIAPPGTNEGAIPAMPVEVMTSGEIRFISGGISDEELRQMKDIQNQFNIHVLMTQANGGYISDATIKLIDSDGNQVLHVSNAGPYFYAAVKMGTYTFEATQGSETKRITLKVGSKGQGTQQIRFNSAG